MKSNQKRDQNESGTETKRKRNGNEMIMERCKMPFVSEQSNSMKTECTIFWCLLYDWWATALNTHQSHFSIHNFVHISSVTQELWPHQVYQTCSMRIKSGGQVVGVECLRVCQKVGVAIYNTFVFFFNLTYMTTFPDATFWKIEK